MSDREPVENEHLRGLLEVANAKSEGCVVCGKLRDRRGMLSHWPHCKHPMVDPMLALRRAGQHKSAAGGKEIK